MVSTSGSATSTTNKTDIWLIGQITPALIQTKLPSIKKVLCLFFYYKIKMKQGNKESANSTACVVLALWKKANIPTRLKKHVVNKILQYFTEWQKLKKNKANKAKRSERIQQKEQEWQTKLEDLFDIAHANVLNMMTDEENSSFLMAQRKNGRPGKISNLDKEYAKREAKKQDKEAWLKRMQRREKQRIKCISERCKLLPTSLSSMAKNDSASMFHASLVPGPSTCESPPRKRGRKTLLNDQLAVSLDIAKLSNRKAAIVLTSTLQSLGCDPLKYNVNISSIRRQRMKHRQKVALSVKSEFTPEVPLTIHWDGKILEDITGHKVVERLPILVSGQGIDQLLAVPKLNRGTGEAAASAIHETILSWNLGEKIKYMSFDTTAANTGSRNGACILLQQKMEKDLLWLACRHHIMELMLEAVVLFAVGPSSGPDILIFKRFKNNWAGLKQDDFKTVSSDASTLKYVENISADTISFAKKQLELYQPRADYKELLILIIIFLGGTLDKELSFRAPAGLHRARWMAKAIYSLKIYLFRDQFKMSKNEENGIKDICIFTVRIYAKYWFQAPSGWSAPRNDLQLLKDLKAYEEINQQIAKAAVKKILSHLWYLSEELVAFAFFDDKVPLETKRKMVNAVENEGLEYYPKRRTLEYDLILNTNLEDFVSSNTLRFFNIAGLSSDFLKKDVELWNDDEDYKTAKAVVHSMRVVNDLAERGVALMEEYNKLHTTNEEQKQYLLLLVKDYRQKFSDSNKSTLLS